MLNRIRTSLSQKYIKFIPLVVESKARGNSAIFANCIPENTHAGIDAQQWGYPSSWLASWCTKNCFFFWNSQRLPPRLFSIAWMVIIGRLVWVRGFCLIVEIHQVGSATNGLPCLSYSSTSFTQERDFMLSWLHFRMYAMIKSFVKRCIIQALQ